MTPAQASGHPDFVTDVATQGPVDQGQREADCRFAQTKLPARPACVDCEGPIPMWARTSLSHTRLNGSGIGEQRLSFGGVGALGFALGDPEIWTKLGTDQQAWIADTLRKLNDKIVSSTGSTCPTWNAASISSTAGCFQIWFNSPGNYGGKLTGPDGKPVVLRTDGVFDQQTLDALRTVAALDPATFTSAYPGTSLPGETGTGEKKLSTAAMLGIGTGVAAVGGLIYAATHGHKGRKGRR